MKKNTSIKRLVYLSTFVALSVAVNSMRVGAVSFGGFPIIFSGFALGPFGGFIVGGMSDVIGFMIRPSSGGSFNPIFALTSALTGMLPVLVTMILKDNSAKFTTWKVFVGIAVGQITTSVVMVPIFLQILYKKPLIVTVARAALKQAISIPIYTLLFVAIYSVVRKSINFKEM